MYTKEQLVEKIKNNKIANSDKIANCLRTWRIDPIYEDEKNIEYYDDLAVYKLNHGIKLKEMGRNNEEISSIVNNGFITPISSPSIKQAQIQTKPNHPAIDLNKVTIDITAQTLSLLAESVAQKITSEITDKFKESNVFEPIMDSAKVKRDNEILSKQVERLLEENKKLITRNVLLQGENAKFKHMFGNWYVREQ
jgi:hypothetical protein